MRKRIYIPSLLLIITALLLVLWARQKHEVPLSTEKPEINATATSVTKNAPVVQKASNQPQNLTSPTTASSPVVNDHEKTNEIRQYLESQNKPVDFFGKVIDQDGNPVAGTKLKGEVLHLKVIAPTAWGSQDEVIPIEKVSDLDGRFEVSGMSGRSLEIESIQNDKYEAEPWQHTYNSVGGNFENPVVFKMWSTNIHEKLITGGQSFHVEPDGRTYVIDLAKGSIAASGDGDLKIWVKRPAQVVLGQHYEWSCEADVINGGLLAADDGSASMYLAPVDGYESAFKFEQKVGSGWGDTTGEKQFYVRLKSGQIYGRITIELMAYYNNQIPGMVRVHYVLNPSGSRILH